MAIGDGLCDPESMTDYGDFLFGIGLIDEDDRDYFSKVAISPTLDEQLFSSGDQSYKTFRRLAWSS
jgi:hypothetical protein